MDPPGFLPNQRLPPTTSCGFRPLLWNSGRSDPAHGPRSGGGTTGAKAQAGSAAGLKRWNPAGDFCPNVVVLDCELQFFWIFRRVITTSSVGFNMLEGLAGRFRKLLLK